VKHEEPISMYVPARNAEGTLSACIAAIRAQTRGPDELFVILDPRSSDRTAEVAAGAGVRVITQQGSTLGAARNEAIAAASDRWLACCDSDVVLEPDWLAHLAEKRDASAAGIGGRTVERIRNPNDEWRALHMPHHWGDYPLRNPFMLVSEVLFDRRALLAVGGYRDDLDYYEDSDLCQRLRDAGYDLLYEPSAIATHQRTDNLLGLLALRWKYSEYRQRRLMDRYAGLMHKCSVNREYALNTLSRSLARRREELAYISFLLFFHHLVMDLGSLLSRRRLITPATRAYYLRELVEAMGSSIAEHHGDLSRAVRADLSELCADLPSDAAEPDAPPGRSWYLEHVRSACGRFCSELPAAVSAIIEASAQYLHGHIGADDLRRLPPGSPETLRAALDAIPIQPVVDEAFCRAVREHWRDLSGIQTVGPLAAQEQAVLAAQAGCSEKPSDPRPVALAAHLEARADPLGAFDEIDAGASRLVVCYQPPARFVPGLDVPLASDLASSAAAAGWTIEQFDTIIGRTRLMLSRQAHT